MTNLFSINKAADLLECDRATLVRALRRVPGGGLETGLQSPDNRTGWFLCDGIKFLEGGCPF